MKIDTKNLPRELPAEMTYGDSLGPCSEFTDREPAARYFNLLVRRLIQHHAMSEDRARSVTLSNIGYWSGYYDSKTATRMLDLFDTTHPIFGKTQPDAETAFRMGQEMVEDASQ